MMSEVLRDQVKRKLNITWSDAGTDMRVKNIISSAESLLRYKLGVPADTELDFAQPGIENVLFLSWCLYEWNHATDEFDDNYAGLMLQARAKYEIAQEGEDEDQDESVQ